MTKTRQKSISQSEINNGLFDFIQKSTSQFHATETIINMLNKADFTELSEKDRWHVKKGGKYYIKRNHSSVIAFTIGKNQELAAGFKMIGAHTDSPGLILKPNSNKRYLNYYQTAVEIYGGPILSSWFDRQLSLAGKIVYLDRKEKIKYRLIDFKRPIATIPNIAIHLDKSTNTNKTIDRHKDITPLLLQTKTLNEKLTFEDLLKKELKDQNKAREIKEILSYELFYYDITPCTYLGIRNDFIQGPRLDNLLSCYFAITALINSEGSNVNKLAICNDHEECGSQSHVGAAGPFLKSILQRLCKNHEEFARLTNNSYLVSCDNAHAVHPNFPNKHDENHLPTINQGPVIKIDNNQRYASNSETIAPFVYLCRKNKIPYQQFVARNDTKNGTTIGPYTSTKLGIKTIDIGVPTFAMHSICELTGAKDGINLYKVLKAFFKTNKAF